MGQHMKHWRKKAAGAILGLFLMIWTTFVLWWVNGTVGYGEELSLYATAAVLMDGDSGRILYEKNGFTPMAMASTTKIMTCILALEHGEVEEVATVSSYAASMPQVKMFVRKGESYQLKDLLYSLMLESHNDSAVVIAEHIGRQYLPELQEKQVGEFTKEESKAAVGAFAALMNEKAKELGCEGSYFITPNGLDAEEIITDEKGTSITKAHVTTAAELARIMVYCIRESDQAADFLKVTQTDSYSFTANGRSFSLNNHNAFLHMMDGALSGKTGFTNKAGYCYVGALERDGKTLVVALLACGWPNHKTYKWSDTKVLMNYGLEHFRYRTLAEVPVNEKQLGQIAVLNGQTQRLGETAFTELSLHPDADQILQRGMLLKEDEWYEVRYVKRKSLTAPVQKGQEAGYLEYSLQGRVYGKIPVITVADVEKIDFCWCLYRILEQFLPK